MFSDHGDAIMYNTDTGYVQVMWLCDTCRSRYYNHSVDAVCPVCSRLVPERRLNEMSVEVDGSHIMCDSCVDRYTFTCSDCSRLVNEEYLSFRQHGNSICERCAEDYYRCEDCADMVRSDDARIDDDSGEAYCSDCYDNHHRYIHSHRYTPHPLFFHGSPHKRHNPKTTYFGCELEVEATGRLDEVAEEIVDSMGDSHVYIKSDGSLNHGFEIVTHPHTFDEMCKLWRERWDERMGGLKSHDTTTCGFHVHVSKQTLTPLHVQKIVVFVNAAANFELVTHVAQRSSERWAKILDKKIGHCGYSPDRYEAVNLTNDNTIEFRIFKGNLKTDRILKNLQFVHATIEFTRTRSYRDLSADAFKEFVSRNRKQYQQLHDFISTPQVGA